MILPISTGDVKYEDQTIEHKWFLFGYVNKRRKKKKNDDIYEKICKVLRELIASNQTT